jgi:hypothetical protein
MLVDTFYNPPIRDKQENDSENRMTTKSRILFG